MYIDLGEIPHISQQGGRSFGTIRPVIREAELPEYAVLLSHYASIGIGIEQPVVERLVDLLKTTASPDLLRQNILLRSALPV